MRVRQRTFRNPVAEPDGSHTEVVVFVAECEHCGFSASSRIEDDARSVIDAHEQHHHLEPKHQVAKDVAASPYRRKVAGLFHAWLPFHR